MTDWNNILEVGIPALLGLAASQSDSSFFNSNIPQAGYQGGIPDYTAVRQAVPGTYDPTRRPGSGGQRYFTDMQFVPSDDPAAVSGARDAAAQQAAEFGVLNATNPANDNDSWDPDWHLDPVYAQGVTDVLNNPDWTDDEKYQQIIAAMDEYNASPYMLSEATGVPVSRIFDIMAQYGRGQFASIPPNPTPTPTPTPTPQVDPSPVENSIAAEIQESAPKPKPRQVDPELMLKVDDSANAEYFSRLLNSDNLSQESISKAKTYIADNNLTATQVAGLVGADPEDVASMFNAYGFSTPTVRRSTKPPRPGVTYEAVSRPFKIDDPNATHAYVANEENVAGLYDAMREFNLSPYDYEVKRVLDKLGVDINNGDPLESYAAVKSFVDEHGWDMSYLPEDDKYRNFEQRSIDSIQTASDVSPFSTRWISKAEANQVRQDRPELRDFADWEIEQILDAEQADAYTAYKAEQQAKRAQEAAANFNIDDIEWQFTNPEEVEYMMSQGSSPDQIAAQMGVPTNEILGVMGYAGGGYLDGTTDGMADAIPASIGGSQQAALSDGEFVIPADVVSHMGNGNSEAGAKALYDMMNKVRKARTGTAEQGPQINPHKYMPV